MNNSAPTGSGAWISATSVVQGKSAVLGNDVQVPLSHVAERPAARNRDILSSGFTVCLVGDVELRTVSPFTPCVRTRSPVRCYWYTLPVPLNTVCVKNRVNTHKGNIFGECLGNNNSVKRITMVERKGNDLMAISYSDG